LYVDSSGNVGIGTSSPTDKLTINGASRTISATVYASGAVQTGNLYWGWEMYNVNSTTNYLQSYNRFSSAYMDSVYNAATHQFWISGAERMRVNSSGYVGIATTTPAALLQVGPTSAGAINGYTKFIVDSTDYAVATWKSPAANFSQIIFTDTTSTSLGGINYFNSTNATPNAMAFLTAATERMRINSSGNVGIGTTTPVAKLAVVGGTTNASDLATAYSTAAFNITPKSTSGYSLAFGSGPDDRPYIQMSAAGTAPNDIMIQPYGGGAGIGITVNNVYDAVAAQRPLVVQRSDTSTTLNGSTAAITIVNGDTTTNNTAQLNFAAITGASTNQYSSAIISAIFGARTNTQYPTGQLVFSTSTSLNTAPSEKMRIDNNGNVGIGTSSPNYR
jgi:hypothetical protein